jgi:hypothetical protein
MGSTWRGGGPQHGTARCSTARCSTAQHGADQRSTAQHGDTPAPLSLGQGNAGRPMGTQRQWPHLLLVAVVAHEPRLERLGVVHPVDKPGRGPRRRLTEKRGTPSPPTTTTFVYMRLLSTCRCRPASPHFAHGQVVLWGRGGAMSRGAAGNGEGSGLKLREGGKEARGRSAARDACTPVHRVHRVHRVSNTRTHARVSVWQNHTPGSRAAGPARAWCRP